MAFPASVLPIGNTVAGVVRLHASAKLNGLEFRPGARLLFDDGTPELLAYPMNRKGWGNLCRMLSAGNMRSKKGICTLWETDLRDWSEHLLFVAIPPSLPKVADVERFETALARIRPWLGDRLHLALVPRYDGLDNKTFGELDGIARRLGLPLVATNDAFYHAPERKPVADVVVAIREHVPIAEAGLRLHAHAERHLKSPAEMARLFRAWPEAIDNNVHFFSRLQFSLDELSHQYPDEIFDGEISGLGAASAHL